MLLVRTGVPYPDLERALREELEEHVARRDFSRLAIIVPSREARRHLRLLIGREWGIGCLGVRLSTAYDFALNALSGAPDRPAHMAPEGLLAVLVRQLAAGKDFPRLSGIAATRGGPESMLRTLHALREAGVPAGKPGRGAPEILKLYAGFERRRDELGLSVPADIVSAAAGAVANSQFVAGFSKVVYYGFYDMTGVQLGLLRALAAAGPVSFFLPCGEGAAWDFSRGFGERLKRDLDAKCEDLRGEEARPPLEAAVGGLFDPAGSARGSARLRAVSASGTEAEVRAAAREVLRLVEEENLGFDEIAVVARSLDPYLPCLENVFGEYRVPFRCSAGRPATEFPPAKAVHALIRALQSDCSRAAVMDLASSPYFGVARLGVEPEWIAGWDALTRRCGVAGREGWSRLSGLAKSRGSERGKEDPDTEPARVKALLALVRALERAAKKTGSRASWGLLGSAFLEAFNDFLDLSDEGQPPRAAGLCDEVRRVVQGMRDFDIVEGEVGPGEFFAALRDRLGSASVEVGGGDVAGVEVLDAMAVRCRSFRAVVLLGAHEGAFPRQVRQDPFLNDAEREGLGARHNLYLPRRGAGHHEERLLFALVLCAAREHLTVVRQRSDDEGKPLVPSWYLQELLRVLGLELAGFELAIPRRLEDYLDAAGDTWGRWLSAREWLRALVLAGERSSASWEQLGSAADAVARSLAAGDAIGATSKRLGERDGIIDAPERFPTPEMIERGFSASFLQDYVRCPFQFFARRVLELEPLEDPDAVQELGALERGQILHKALEIFFGELRSGGYFEAGKVDVEKLLAGSFERAAEGFARANATGWPLSWGVALEGLEALAAVYVQAELARLEKGGFKPVEAERSVAAPAPRSIRAPKRFRPLHLFGRIDRLDEGEVEGEAVRRIVDYKLKLGKSVDVNLAQQAVRGESLQPPIYLLLAARAGKAKCRTSAEFHYLAPNWPRGPVAISEFSGESWEQPVGRQVSELIAAVLAGVDAGNYFVQPGRHCEYCDFAPLCRKSHRATRYRHAADSLPRALEAFASAKPEKPAKAGGSGGKAAKKTAKKSAKKTAAKKRPAGKGRHK